MRSRTCTGSAERGVAVEFEASTLMLAQARFNGLATALPENSQLWDNYARYSHTWRTFLYTSPTGSQLERGTARSYGVAKQYVARPA